MKFVREPIMSAGDCFTFVEEVIYADVLAVLDAQRFVVRTFCEREPVVVVETYAPRVAGRARARLPQRWRRCPSSCGMFGEPKETARAPDSDGGREVVKRGFLGVPAAEAASSTNT